MVLPHTTKHIYTVIEGSGTDDQRTMEIFTSFKRADNYVLKHYEQGEIDSLNVLILRDGSADY
jgi:hypothetical protein